MTGRFRLLAAARMSMQKTQYAYISDDSYLLRPLVSEIRCGGHIMGLFGLQRNFAVQMRLWSAIAVSGTHRVRSDLWRGSTST